MYHFTDGGLRNVWLSNGYEVRMTRHGEAVAITDLTGLVTAICSSLIRKKSKLTGVEFRYIRSAMLMSQSALGQAIGVQGQTIAIWEKRGVAPKHGDTMIRVLYALHTNGDEKIKNIVSSLNEAERTVHLIMTSTRIGWRSNAQNEPEITESSEA
jgi:DNA-binding transcriptional regulator YiaG